MCILCIASRWSRHIAAMVMPMVTLWAISQFLPQGFRFEINSPKLACIGVLFVSLSWFELVMPRISAWRARRIAALKEKRRLEAQEAAKRRKKAIRRCRNCDTPYKDQNPASGRFMCTFCGHVSKRPWLEFPVGPSNSSNNLSLPGSAVEFLSGGFFSVNVSPKYWYDRASFIRPNWVSGRSWIAVGPWIDGVSWGTSTSWFGGAWPASSLYFVNAGLGWPGSAGNLFGDGVFGGERWFAGDSCSGVIWFVVRVFSQVLVFTVWIWRKLSRSNNAEDCNSNKDNEACDFADVVENSNFEAKDKKSRRKAEEKRLARLEKELQEAEERKQREEVARLVEERRRQRVKKEGLDEIMSTSTQKDVAIERRSERREARMNKKEKASYEKDTFTEQSIEDKKEKCNPVAAKNMKPFGNTGGKEKDSDNKPAATSISKWSAFEPKGSRRSKLLYDSKKTPITTKRAENLFNDMDHPGIMCKKPVSVMSFPSPASTSSKKGIEVCTSISGSPWTQSPFSNVVSCGGSEAELDTSQSASIVHNSSEVENTFNSDMGMESLTSSSKFDTLRQQLQTSFSPGCAFVHSKTVIDSKAFVDSKSSSQTEYQISTSTYGNADNYSSDDHVFLQFKDVISCQCSEDTNHSSDNSSRVSIHNKSLFSDCQSSVLQSSQPMAPNAALHLAGNSTHVSNVRISASLSGNESTDRLPHGSTCVCSSEMPTFTICETSSSSSLPLKLEMLQGSETFKKSTSYWLCESEMFSMQDVGVMHQENGKYGSFLHPLGTDILPVDASSQHKEDLYQQITVDPEFYLPSSLLSFEESDSCECCCKGSIHGNNISTGPDVDQCEPFAWEDWDVRYKVPPEFVDCITHSLMQDPVITADGHSYERSAIEDWLKLHDTSPKTGEQLPPPPGGKGVDKSLRPNHILRCQIMEFKERILQRVCRRSTASSTRPR
ncbi:hypothetical protein KP509_11G068900 [Ceratopteris richardii]|uniref:U-box domain-containing protein n=1 Tax=Ceratopteris richardii TaxID=49495 RepID=A0A8T2TTY9_CERRI|nr:hypothetical protein KP509_11G068900 [Ceratopteris richardii]